MRILKNNVYFLSFNRVSFIVVSLSSFEYEDWAHVTGHAISPSYVLGWDIEVKVSLIYKKLFGSRVPTLGSMVNLSPQAKPIFILESCILKSKVKDLSFDIL